MVKNGRERPVPVTDGSRQLSADDLMRLVTAPKGTAGQFGWTLAPERKPDQVPFSRTYDLRIQLTIEGQIIPGLLLRGRALEARYPQDLNLRLQLHKAVLARATLFPDGLHTNRLPRGDGRTLPAGRPRYYPYRPDRDYPPSTGGPWFAELITEPVDTAEALIQYCRSKWFISEPIPTPPYNPVLL